MNPLEAKTHHNLGNLYVYLGLHEEAIGCYKKAIEIEPNCLFAKLDLHSELQACCYWSEILKNGEDSFWRECLSAQKMAIEPVNPFILQGFSFVSSSVMKICAQQWALKLKMNCSQVSENQIDVSDDNYKNKLNIGYISANFNDHVVARQIVKAFECHDHNRFNIIGFSCGLDDRSDLRKRLEKSFDKFIDIRDCSAEEVAKQIRKENVDILVDLTGYTRFSRTDILFLKPAAIQVNFLGYPGTLGADVIDYIISDKFIIPAESEKYYTEKVIRLPDCYMPNDTNLTRPVSPSRQECGLPEEGVVFCDFNNTFKITPVFFDIWCNLLKSVPDSVLWLRDYNSSATLNLKKEAAIRGVNPDRIVMAPFADTEMHLARLQCADLFLDTSPYNAHATCANALWMGLPVITCAGETFASRVAGSLLTTLGVPELITYTLEGYYELALELAKNHEKREKIRAKVMTQRDTSPLFDMVRFTRNLEDLYLQMWDEKMVRKI